MQQARHHSNHLSPPTTTTTTPQFGVFARTKFAPGDAILQEGAEDPLIQLAPSNEEEEWTILQQYLQLPHPDNATGTTYRTCNTPKRTKLHHNGRSVDDISSKTSTSSTTSDGGILWRMIQPPPDVSETGKFRGMVQAALCYVYRDPSFTMQSKLLQLYHPYPLASTSRIIASTSATESPRMDSNQNHPTILLRLQELSRRAIQYLQQYVRKDSPFDHYLKTQPELLQRIMLIWSCNAFEGGYVYEIISRFNHSCNPNAMIMVVVDDDDDDKEEDNDCNARDEARTDNDNRIHDQKPDAIPPIRLKKIDRSGERGAQARQTRQQVQAIAPIQANAEITISYLDLLLYADWRTRQNHLKRDKHFECRCTRCSTAYLEQSISLASSTSPTTQTSVDRDRNHNDSSVLQWTKADRAAAIPCVKCHPRIRHGYLEEDVQYDDDQLVHYMYPFYQTSLSYKSGINNTNEPYKSEREYKRKNLQGISHDLVRPDDVVSVWICTHCQSKIHSADPVHTPVFRVVDRVVHKIGCYLDEYYTIGNHTRRSKMGRDEISEYTYDCYHDEEEEHMTLLEEHLQLAYSILGCRHWTTNLLFLEHVTFQLRALHRQMILDVASRSGCQGGNAGTRNAGNEKLESVDRGEHEQRKHDTTNEERLTEIAQVIDTVQRLVRFVQGVGLKLHLGHVLAESIVGIIRILIYLGDDTSKKYAMEWLSYLQPSMTEASKPLRNDSDGINDGSSDGNSDEESPPCDYFECFGQNRLRQVVAILCQSCKTGPNAEVRVSGQQLKLK